MGILRKKINKVVSAALAASIIFTGISGLATCRVNAAEVVAASEVFQVLQGILLSAGVSYVTTDMISSSWSGWTDGSSALDDDWQQIYDDMEDKYNSKRNEILSGGGSDNDPREFKDLVAAFATNGQIDWEIRMSGNVLRIGLIRRGKLVMN